MHMIKERKGVLKEVMIAMRGKGPGHGRKKCDRLSSEDGHEKIINAAENWEKCSWGWWAFKERYHRNVLSARKV